jgi:hypothetical protein
VSRQTKEFHAFDSLLGKLLTVPKSTIHERHAEHKERAALNPNVVANYHLASAERAYWSFTCP